MRELSNWEKATLRRVEQTVAPLERKRNLLQKKVDKLVEEITEVSKKIDVIKKPLLDLNIIENPMTTTEDSEHLHATPFYIYNGEPLNSNLTQEDKQENEE